MVILLRKTTRDLRRRLTQSAAIAVMVTLGVLLFIASYDSFRNLSTSYQRTYQRLHFAELTASGGDPDVLAASVADARGVARVSTRTQADRPLLIRGTKLMGRVSGLTADNESAVDSIDVVAGRMPAAGSPGEVAVERHAADTFGLSPGDHLDVYNGAGWSDAAVTGIAVSPEYLWAARSRQEILPDPHSFAVVFAPQAQAQRLADQQGPNQTLVRMTSRATPADRDRVRQLLISHGAVDVQSRAEQPSNAALHEDLDGFSELSVGFPVLFLTAAAIAEYVVITRVVRGDRRIIGTMLAMGARPGAVVRHYLWYGGIVTTVGAAAGVVAGAAATSVVTGLYTSAIGVPDTVVSHRIGTAVIGFALGVLTGLIAVLAPAIGAARIAPAEAMRGDPLRATRVGPLTRMTARWRLPAVIQLALRSLTRNRRRTAATMVGSVLALILILASIGMLTSMRKDLDVQFGQIQREDASVLVVPGSLEPAAQLRSIPGVTAVEPGTMTPVTAMADARTYTTTLTGFTPDTSMHGFRRADDGQRSLPGDGVLAGAALAHKLDVGIGTIITVVADDGRSRRVRLAGLLDEPLGTSLYATNATVTSIAGDPSERYLLKYSGDADREQLRAVITGLPGVLAYSDTHALQDIVNRYLGLFWVFIGAMLALGAVLAFAVIYVTMSVNLAERSTELATLRAAGVSTPRLTATLATENLAATTIALPAGLVAGAATAWAFLRSFNSDLFTLNFWLDPSTLALAALAILGAAAMSQLPAARLVNKVDIARVVRERAQ